MELPYVNTIKNETILCNDEGGARSTILKILALEGPALTKYPCEVIINIHHSQSSPSPGLRSIQQVGNSIMSILCDTASPKLFCGSFTG